MKILVTGGAGFIGSAFIRHVLTETTDAVVNVDKLTYAACLDSLSSVASSPRYMLEEVDIVDRIRLERVFQKHRPDLVLHLAAETHVDRSIDRPADFIETNVVGTGALLDVSLDYWKGLTGSQREGFRLHHVSSDEVFGELGPTVGPSMEASPYKPSSPYAATKAAADHLVRAWGHTYGLPTVVTNCTNNYGPWQFPEKLIPLMIMNAVKGTQLPVYGHGDQVRDWLHVEDHVRALHLVLHRGRSGESYNISSGEQRTNIDVVRSICKLLDGMPTSLPKQRSRFEDLIAFVDDRPGHDRRYAINSNKVRSELGWQPRETFRSGLEKTVRWYLDNIAWLQKVQTQKDHGQQLGMRYAAPETVG